MNRGAIFGSGFLSRWENAAAVAVPADCDDSGNM